MYMYMYMCHMFGYTPNLFRTPQNIILLFTLFQRCLFVAGHTFKHSLFQIQGRAATIAVGAGAPATLRAPSDEPLSRWVIHNGPLWQHGTIAPRVPKKNKQIFVGKMP